MRTYLGCAILLLLPLTVGCGNNNSSHRVAEPPNVEKMAKNEAARKIVYHGQIDLETTEFAKLQRSLKETLHEFGGFVAEYNEHREYDQCYAATWTLRIPAAKFDAAVEKLASLGTTVRRELKSEDVTDVTTDIDARLKNQRQLEARLLEIIAKQTGDLEAVLRSENELARVRGTIEQMEAQQRLYADRVALSTLVVQVTERKEFIPPVEPTYAQQLGMTFSQSLALIRECGQAILLIIVFLLPWLTVGIVFAVPLFLLLWRASARTSRAR